MNPRAEELIRLLDLQPHPEGGFYRETFRSSLRVTADPGRSRSALTTIHFLLAAGSFSAWHRVRSDEAWHWHEGESLELLLAPPGFGKVHRRLLGPLHTGGQPVAVVPADWWQAARPLGDYALCGCTVGPGFEFEDFTLLRGDSPACEALRARGPGWLSLL